ncbi:MAG TPA: nuclear transport factor 2 family protein [Gemmatimonadaceae bacterium]|nr:nuclear transport factor 2 family protein [Gemmatimonadaceae bacterium]
MTLRFFAAAAVATACAGAVREAGEPRPADAAAARAEIASLMQRAAGDWTRGDLDAFMSDYLPGEGTTYIGGRGLLRGVDAIRAAYAPRFAPGVARDSLHFEGLEVDLLAPGVAHVLAYYVLSRGDSIAARGPTSLVMRRVDGRWRIVHDHSS